MFFNYSQTWCFTPLLFFDIKFRFLPTAYKSSKLDLNNLSEEEGWINLRY